MDYKKILEGVVNIINTTEKSDIGFANICTYIGENCPEPRESENIRIIKAIKYSLDHVFTNNTTVFEVTKEQCLAWLEKQGEHANFRNKIQIGDKVTRNEDGVLVNLSQLNRVAKKQGEQKLYVNDNAKEMFIKALERVEEQNNKGYKLTDCDKNSWWEDFKAYTSCIIEQKSADKVEPKFSEGEWITNGDYTWKVVEVKPFDYILQSQDGNIVDDTISHVDEQFHSFTPEDAKDGDVLINWNNTTFIFKTIEDESVKFHIAYNEKWDTIKTPSSKLSHLGLPEPQFEFYPATKEQCDLLFQKMKEAGYEWDVNKKELKKIIVPIFNIGDTIIKKHNSDINDFGSFTITDITGGKYWYNDRIICDITEQDEWEIYEPVRQNPAWSEEDKMILQYAIEHFERQKRNCIEGGGRKKAMQEFIDWLKSLKDRCIPQPKQKWSEEDEKRTERLLGWLDTLVNYIHYDAIVSLDLRRERMQQVEQLKTWLKSLSPQSTWKPNDEQLCALEHATMYNTLNVNDAANLATLYNDLKKLKG